MPIKWVELEFKEYKKANKETKLTISEYGFECDSSEGGLRRLNAYRDNYAALIILYGFLGMEKMPFPRSYVLEKKPGYIRLRARDGRVFEHSGRYSVIN